MKKVDDDTMWLTDTMRLTGMMRQLILRHIGLPITKAADDVAKFPPSPPKRLTTIPKCHCPITGA